MKRERLVFAGLGVVVGLVAGAFAAAVYFDGFNWFETPEECFVREMKAWRDKHGASVPILDEGDTELVFAKFKVIAKEYEVENLTDNAQKVYRATLATADYCKTSLKD